MAGIITDGLLTPDLFFLKGKKKKPVLILYVSVWWVEAPESSTLVAKVTRADKVVVPCLFPGNAQEQNCKIFILCIVSSIMQNQ